MPQLHALTAEALARLPRINPDPVMALSAEGVVRYANAAADRLLEAWACQRGDPLPEAWRQAVAEVMAEGEPVAFEAPVGDRLFSFRLVPELAGTKCLHLYAVDDTEGHRARHRLWQLAHYDPLTGLANRHRLSQHLAFLLGPEEGAATVFYLGIDRFKNIVAGLGHAQADGVLEAVAERLTHLFPECLVARVHGDEFAVAIPDQGKAQGWVREEMERVQRAFASVVCARRAPFPVSLSMGVASAGAGEAAEDLLWNAHSAMARAKAAGPGRGKVFDESLRREFQHRLRLETDLQEALEEGAQLVVHYQPVVALPGSLDRAAGFEALVRWAHPELGWLSPGAFVPMAEDAGLVGRMGWQVLAQAAAQAAAWNRGASAPVRVSVNLAPQQVLEAGVAAQVASILADAGCDPAWIRLELTESALEGDPHWIRGNLEALRELGCSLSLDDFGTGYASLAHLHDFPFDELKVDRTFVAEAPSHHRSRELVRTIVAMARGLGLAVVAEGVETEAELDLMRELGVDKVQGFRFAAALPGDDAGTWL